MSEILVIPGVGDERSFRVQARYIRLLNVFRRNRYAIFDSQWFTDETLEEKNARLSEFYESVGCPAVLYAFSAGASRAVPFAHEHQDKISSLHLVCGKILTPESIGENYTSRAPALVASVTESSQFASQIEDVTTTCYVPVQDADKVIDSRDMVVPNARIVDLPKLKHASAIAYAYVRYLPFL